MARGRPPISADMVKISFSLPRDLRDRFTERMRADDLPASSILRHAIEEYLRTPRPVFFGAASADRPAPMPPPAPVTPSPPQTPPPILSPLTPASPSEVGMVARPIGAGFMDMIWAANEELYAEQAAEAEAQGQGKDTNQD